jgi:hypothetical protein
MQEACCVSPHSYEHSCIPLLLLWLPVQLTMGTKSPDRVAYQGVPGAYSEMAARKACPGCEPLPCEQFEVAFQVRAAQQTMRG